MNKQSFLVNSWSVTKLSISFLSFSVYPTAAVSVLISSHILANLYYIRLLNFLFSGRCCVLVEPAQKLKGRLMLMWKWSSHSAHEPPYFIYLNCKQHILPCRGCAIANVKCTEWHFGIRTALWLISELFSMWNGTGVRCLPPLRKHLKEGQAFILRTLQQ